MSGRNRKRHHLRPLASELPTKTPKSAKKPGLRRKNEKVTRGSVGKSTISVPELGTASAARQNIPENIPVASVRGAVVGMVWSLLRAAEEFGVSRETIRRGLRMRGIEKTENFSTREIFVAIAGDWDFEHTRRERAEANIAERNDEIDAGTVVPYEDVAGYIRETFAPLREKIVALPSRLAALCNPTDPEHALKHLVEFRDEFLRHKEKLPPPPKVKVKS